MKGPVLHCSSCGKPCPPEGIRYTLYERSPQQYQGVTAAHLCTCCGQDALKVFALNLQRVRKAIRAEREGV